MSTITIDPSETADAPDIGLSARVARAGALALALLLAAMMLLFKAAHAQRIWYATLIEAYSLLACAFVLSRIAISALYREPEDAGYEPRVSVIIAAKNEEEAIARTIEACAASFYPSERLEIIVVDDGSTDGTWAAAQPLRESIPNLRLIRFETNRGKRHAMAAGIGVATGEVLVFVDSDSAPRRDGLRRLVQPLADRRVGAVAGHVVVDVDPEHVISKMESVRYYIGHRLIKASESVFGAVTCCPGPFSAYRRDAVLAVLDGWLNQRFLGKPATFGDDRSLTLRVLAGHRVVFHAGAVCVTKVPSRWPVFFRQQLRWKKSWMRELLPTCRLMLREHAVAAASYYAGAVITLVSPLVLLYTAVYLPLFSAAHPTGYVLGFFASYACLSLVCYSWTGMRWWYYGPFFGAVYVCVLVWQNYYAILTLDRNAWGTR